LQSNFAVEWIEAWNSHDLDRILSHYSKDLRLSSPFIAQIFGEPSGTLHGIEAVREYWRAALTRRSDLHFELVSLLVGVTSIVIVFNMHDGRLGAEQFEFDENGVVIRSSAHYAN
jgi:ketosteroid isomerase-like protein